MIKAETYNVNIVNTPWEICLEKELKIEQSNFYLGRAEPIFHRITITTACDKITFIRTFWHEVTHAYLTELGHYNNTLDVETICEVVSIIQSTSDELTKTLNKIVKAKYKDNKKKENK